MFKRAIKILFAAIGVGGTALSLALGRQILSPYTQIEFQINLLTTPTTAYKWGRNILTVEERKAVEPIIPILELYESLAKRLDVKIAKDENNHNIICFGQQCSADTPASTGFVTIEYYSLNSGALLDDVKQILVDNKIELLARYESASSYIEKSNNNEYITSTDIELMREFSVYLRDILIDLFQNIEISESKSRLVFELSMTEYDIFGFKPRIWTFFSDEEYLIGQIETILGFDFDEIFDIVDEINNH